MKCTWEAAKGEVSLQYKSSGIKTRMLFLQHTPKNFSENQTWARPIHKYVITEKLVSSNRAR